MKSIDILKELNMEQANDLYLPAITLYPSLNPSPLTPHPSPFFSGSGSSFFKVKNNG